MYIYSNNYQLVYNDTEDHYKNGLLRLMNMDEAFFKEWLDTSSTINSEQLIEKLACGFEIVINKPIVTNELLESFGPRTEIGSTWFNSIANYPEYGIVLSNDKTIAWLGNSSDFVISSPEYTETYFEGNKSSGGYGNYLAQESWRLEKAKKQVVGIIEKLNIKSGRVLDIGCGYGFFRKALADFGFDHYGVEISKFASKVCFEKYGFHTYNDDFLNLDFSESNFNLITLWDVIEHVQDPISYLEKINLSLDKDGILIIKTPNINCPEVKVFGSNYHSFKREHLTYFSARSLEQYANIAGFDLIYIETLSHLLKGFFNDSQIKTWESNLMGSDIVAYFRKK